MSSDATSEPCFSVYGYRFRIRGDVEDAVQGIADDFAFFRCEPHPEASLLELRGEEPPYDLVPITDASVYTPRNVVYRSGHVRYLDFHGRGLGIHDSSSDTYRVYSRDPHLLYEAAYLFLLSRIGDFQDRRGLHRLHALAVSIGGRAVLVLLPMGGGKSTLAMSLMALPEVSILSDDSPFIDRAGRALAFPLRIGLLPGGERDIPSEHYRVIQRMEFGPKMVLGYHYIASRVCASAEPGLVLLGRRTLAPGCRIRPASLIDGFRACVSNCIVGVGLFQGMEFVLSHSGWEILGKAGTAWSRARNCYRLLRRSHVAFLHLGRDSAQNAAAVAAYARQVLS